MSEWKWKFWVFGWAYAKQEKHIIDMGPEKYIVWKQLRGQLYKRWFSIAHFGRYWEAVRIPDGS